MSNYCPGSFSTPKTGTNGSVHYRFTQWEGVNRLGHNFRTQIVHLFLVSTLTLKVYT